MRRMVRVLLVLFLLLLPQQGAAGPAPYFTAEKLDLTKLLAPPPAVGSPEQLQEMARLVSLRAECKDEKQAAAQADVERTVFRFADVAGSNFAPDKLPLARALFESVARTASAVVDPAKDFWNRPRPYTTNPDLATCVRRPHGPSYPSGHSTFGTVTAIVLANMLPEKAAAIYDRAARYRFHRELGGVHYPSDVEAGRIAGTLVAAFLFQDTAFLAEFAKAKAEVRQALGLQP